MDTVGGRGRPVIRSSGGPAWIVVVLPEGLCGRMYRVDKEEFKFKAEMEGLGYTVMWYYNPKSIVDPELRQLVEDARELLFAIEELLEDVDASPY